MATTRKRKYKKRRKRKTSKSINLGHGFKLNISQSGINVSGGIKGARVSLGNKGLKTTLSVPGTDIRKTKTLVSTKDILNPKDDKKEKTDSSKDRRKDTDAKDGKTDRKKPKDTMLKSPEEQSKPDKPEITTEERLEALNAPTVESETNEIVKSLKVVKQSLGLTPWLVLSGLGIIISLFILPVGILILLIGLGMAGRNYFSSQGKAKRIFNQGVKAFQVKDMDLALTKMKEASTIDQGNKYYNKSIALLQIEEFKDYQAAKIYLKRLVEKNKSKTGKMELAKCHIMTGESKQAIPYLEELLEEYRFKKDQLLEVKYYLGQSYLDELEFEKAKELLSQVSKEDPDYQGVQRLLERLN